MREALQVDFAGVQPLEAPALFIATLARPGAREEEARFRLTGSLCTWLIRQRCVREPQWAVQPQPIKPAYLSLSDAHIKADMRTLERRMKDRICAGHMAVAFLKEAESGVTPDLPDGAKHLSLNELSKVVAPDRGIESPENVETRVWRPSLPVIHLCAAWVVTLQQRLRDLGSLPDIVELYTDPAFLVAVLLKAELYVPLLEKSRLKVSPDRLVRFQF